MIHDILFCLLGRALFTKHEDLMYFHGVRLISTVRLMPPLTLDWSSRLKEIMLTVHSSKEITQFL